MLYQATGVLNLAFGAIGAAGALIAYCLINHTSLPALARLPRRASLFGGVVNLVYGMRARPRLRAARPARQDDGHARAGADPARPDGLARAGRAAHSCGSCRCRPRPRRFELFGRGRQLDAGHRARVRARDHGRDDGVFLRFTNLGTAMRALANDREITATLGVPVRRVEASAWLGSGLVCGAAGLLLADLLHVARLLGADVPRHLVARRRADRPAAVALGRRSPAASRSGSCRRCSPRTRRSRRTAAPRRSCSRSSRCSGSRATASSRSRGRRGERHVRPRCRIGGVRARESRGRLVGIAVFLRVVALRPPCRRSGGDWITTFTSVAIYSVVAAGLRDPLRAGRDDLARPDRAARDRHLDRRRGSPTRRRSRSRCCSSSPA